LADDACGEDVDVQKLQRLLADVGELMNVTIISDASHCPNLNVGSYGFWAVSKRGSHGGGGVLTGTQQDALVCEAKAIVNAIHCALKLGIAADGDNVLLQTDCMHAIFHLDKRIKKVKRKDLKAIGAAFDKLKAEHSLVIELRHVRGHTRVMDQRSKAQRMTDKRARENLAKARKVVKLKAIGEVHAQ
jgi:hypothetical protein